ncbi:MAG: proliferating cell nuclear antigen (pcna) [Nitrososphaerota archaeon]|nr:proliferating cell nuclear antigen (pcna) [Nitrososphaerota archaeon]MDG6976014.1 proliferating cell nuclear antigen (pcna) [Nitrososphaerota archaeon]MDG6981308.1 proliferating cell nuclear antigen (pcna) [Nitrososphaerota archaeon]MDG6991346.1 proliferating cell nuclear antigen (pcna) [Nitrososphaerota archaeon]MDG7026932.1 proliferating cell nuclear antigen (pcna) [Nitrososphaerota archaeon]
MFLAKSASTTEWRAISAAVKTLVEEATFEATSEGLTFRAMDPSHVALVDLTLPNSSFSSYSCQKPTKFSVRVEDLVKLVGRGDPKDSLEIRDTEEDSLAFTFQNGYKREFTIHLIESTAASAPLPKLELETKATLTKSILDKVLADMSVVADQVTIQATKDRLTFSGKSDIGKADVSLNKSDADVLKLESAADSKASFSIEYIQSILKALSSVADTVDLAYSSKKPLVLTFALNSQGAKLLFYLAPRVSSD